MKKRKPLQLLNIRLLNSKEAVSREEQGEGTKWGKFYKLLLFCEIYMFWSFNGLGKKRKYGNSEKSIYMSAGIYMYSYVFCQCFYSLFIYFLNFRVFYLLSG